MCSPWHHNGSASQWMDHSGPEQISLSGQCLWPQVCIPQRGGGNRRLLSSVDLYVLDARNTSRPEPAAAPSSAPAGSNMQAARSGAAAATAAEAATDVRRRSFEPPPAPTPFGIQHPLAQPDGEKFTSIWLHRGCHIADRGGMFKEGSVPCIRYACILRHHAASRQQVLGRMLSCHRWLCSRGDQRAGDAGDAVAAAPHRAVPALGGQQLLDDVPAGRQPAAAVRGHALVIALAGVPGGRRRTCERTDALLPYPCPPWPTEQPLTNSPCSGRSIAVHCPANHILSLTSSTMLPCSRSRGVRRRPCQGATCRRCQRCGGSRPGAAAHQPAAACRCPRLSLWPPHSVALLGVHQRPSCDAHAADGLPFN